MARGRKAFTLPVEIAKLLEIGKDTVERKSDQVKVPYTFPMIPEAAENSAELAKTVFDALDTDTQVSVLNAKLKSTPRNAAANGVDENTRRAEELISRIKKGDKNARKDLAELLSSME